MTTQLGPPCGRVIIALDYPTAEAALRLVDDLGDEAEVYKVGLELYTADGERVLEGLRQRGKRVFLDLKLHDIPNTVGSSVRVIARKGMALTTLHTMGGFAMMKAASDALASEPGGEGLTLLGVTVLTSIDEDMLRNELSISESIPRLVKTLAGVARDAGLGGVVASALELPLLREALGDDFIIVTPGIRPRGADVGDQKRVMTPGDAFRNGASYIVMGRPVTAAKNPRDAARGIFDELAEI